MSLPYLLLALPQAGMGLAPGFCMSFAGSGPSLLFLRSSSGTKEKSEEEEGSQPNLFLLPGPATPQQLPARTADGFHPTSRGAEQGADPRMRVS